MREQPSPFTRSAERPMLNDFRPAARSLARNKRARDRRRGLPRAGNRRHDHGVQRYERGGTAPGAHGQIPTGSWS